MAVFLVQSTQSGPAWDAAQPLEGQSGWTEHAEFMDRLVDEGVVLLGGPLDGRRVVLVVEANSAADVEAILAGDPWSGSHLQLEAVEPWTIRLDGRRRLSPP
jgi:uncharacterized protein YciI